MKTFKKLIIGTVGPVLFFGTLGGSLFVLTKIPIVQHTDVGCTFGIILSLVIAGYLSYKFIGFVEGDDYLD